MARALDRSPFARNDAFASPDAVQQRAIAELEAYTSWLTGGGLSIAGNGVLEEIGWPGTQSQAVDPSDSPLWNLVGELYLRKLDTLGLGALFWWTGVGSEAEWNTNLYAPSAPGGVLGATGTTVQAEAVTFEGHRTTGSAYRGVSMAPDMINSSSPYYATGGPAPITAGGVFSNINPGVAGTDYWIPDSSSIAWLAARGHKIIRLPVSWEILQPTFSSSLDSAYLTAIQDVIGYANSAGMLVNISLFNSNGYFTGTSDTDVTLNTVGYSSTWTPADEAAFTDLWNRLSAALAGTPGLHAYNILNEAHVQPEGTTTGSQLNPDPGFESDTVGDAPPGCVTTNCTATVSSTYAHSGSNSAELAVSSAGTLVFSGEEWAVTPGDYYLGEVWVYGSSASIQADVTAAISWYNSSGTLLSTTYGYEFITMIGYWASGRAAGTAPSGAAYGRVTLQVYSTLTSSQPLWVDDLQAWQCTSILTGQQVWADLSQAAIDAIRDNDTATEIWLNNYWGSIDWAAEYPSGPWATDSANKLRYAAHHYWDHAISSGGVYAASYAAELAADIAAGY
jgi:Cellulase (glycosyl hydrolase family 5)